jgi:hypothetical protein
MFSFEDPANAFNPQIRENVLGCKTWALRIGWPRISWPATRHMHTHMEQKSSTQNMLWRTGDPWNVRLASHKTVEVKTALEQLTSGTSGTCCSTYRNAREACQLIL